ncbi:sigma-70 family RNA polymerase sigma factor [Fimbriiglobus ruber]|nr:sigma-70 family RNA polymerase sigma factor [Fimbriiglobus ruber]
MPDRLLTSAAAVLTASDPTPDHVLLGRFVADADDVAFELLVRRHSDLVWKVCRGILREDHHAAEDAFQATFLALARGSRSAGLTSGHDGTVGGWLFRVARHAALKARNRAAARPTYPLPGALPGRDSPPDESAAAGELAATVAEEVDRLAPRFRDPVLLCFYAGHTHSEAAARLGWPIGTVASRLARAKDRLRARLARRGVLFGVSASVILVPQSASAVHLGIVRACVRTATGRAVASEPVRLLTEGVLAAMTTAKLKWTAAFVALLIGVASAGTVWAVGGGSEPPTAAKAPDPPKTDTPPAAARAEPDKKPAGPVLQKVAGPLERALSQRNLAAVARAIQAYHLDHGYLPTDILGKNGKPLLSWRVAILPYMEQKALYRMFKLDEPWDSENNKKWASTLVKIYLAGVENRLDSDGYGLTYVKRFTGPNTLHIPGSQVDLRNIPDGRANTLLLAEVGDPVPWTKPTDPVVEPADPAKDPITLKTPPVWKGPYSNVVNVAFATGEAASLKTNLTAIDFIVPSLVLWNDGRVLPERGELIAAPSVEQDVADTTELMLAARKMADQLVKLCEEEAKLRAELARLRKAPADTATPLADHLIGIDAQIRDLRHQVRQLKEEVDKSKK